jgi:hypothetical protein
MDIVSEDAGRYELNLELLGPHMAQHRQSKPAKR